MMDRAPGNESKDESAPDMNTPGFKPRTQLEKKGLNIQITLHLHNYSNTATTVLWSLES